MTSIHDSDVGVDEGVELANELCTTRSVHFSIRGNPKRPLTTVCAVHGLSISIIHPPPSPWLFHPLYIHTTLWRQYDIAPCKNARGRRTTSFADDDARSSSANRCICRPRATSSKYALLLHCCVSSSPRTTSPVVHGQHIVIVAQMSADGGYRRPRTTCVRRRPRTTVPAVRRHLGYNDYVLPVNHGRRHPRAR